MQVLPSATDVSQPIPNRTKHSAFHRQAHDPSFDLRGELYRIAGVDLTEAEHHSCEGAAPDHPSDASPASKDFGPNEWLVDELYQRYLADPGSVDMAWWNFFADYQPPKGSASRVEASGSVVSPARPGAAPAAAWTASTSRPSTW